MPYDIYGQPLRPGHCEVHIGQPHRYGTEACYFEDLASEPPTVEEECAARGHAIAGQDGPDMRCYCGQRRVPA